MFGLIQYLSVKALCPGTCSVIYLPPQVVRKVCTWLDSLKLCIKTQDLWEEQCGRTGCLALNSDTFLNLSAGHHLPISAFLA